VRRRGWRSVSTSACPAPPTGRCRATTRASFRCGCARRCARSGWRTAGRWCWPRKPWRRTGWRRRRTRRRGCAARRWSPAWRWPRALAGFALAFWLLAGLAGALMLYLWMATAHSFAYGNENLLLLSPLCLGLLPGAWALLHGREPGTWFRALLVLVVAGAVLAGFLKFLPFRPQENVEWVLLLLPLHWALLRRLAPKSAGVPLDQGQGGSPG